MFNTTNSLSCEINICQNNGQCFLFNSSINNFTCICTRCYTDSFCQTEKYSQNLWYMGISDDKRFSNYQIIERIIGLIISIISLICNCLALQIFVCSKTIRITNLGIYLIILSLSCLIISILRGIFISIVIFNNPIQLGNVYFIFQCATIRLFASSIICCLFWLLLYIAVERILLAYSFVNLNDSRKRSIISCILLFIIIPTLTFSIIFFGSKKGNTSTDFCRLNFTSKGYIFYSIFRWFNYLIAPIASLISCICILHNLIQHRLYLTTHSETLASSVKLIISNHQDFFMVPLVFTLCIMPYFILTQIVTCSSADNFIVGKLTTIFQLLSDLALIIPFLTTVLPSKLYMEHFWEISHVGRFLIYIKTKLCTHNTSIKD
ncbi:hypothetical protein I4U23_017183 [Adineta vaga]|nr:hypothetical protein I4U23_017183 [Adineta vaga]